jgi:glutathionyl-hydroquinone reductase
MFHFIICITPLIRDLFIYCPHRPSVPVLWDKKKHTIVNNESAEIIRIFNTAFNDLLPAEKAKVDLYPANLQSEIDEVNEWVYPNINSTCVVLVNFFLTSGAIVQMGYIELE